MVPICTGPLRGLRWQIGAGVHGQWIGCYESVQTRAFASRLRPGAVVYDVGAHAGWYTLLAARLVGPSRVVAIEPLARNVAALRFHLARNGFDGVAVLQAAAADAEGEAVFAAAENSYMGRLAPDGSVRVRTVTLDGLVARGVGPQPTLIKIDVEGAELAVLQGARRILRTARPLIVLATHHRTLAEACQAELTAAGYRVSPLGAQPDPDDAHWLAEPAVQHCRDSRPTVALHDLGGGFGLERSTTGACECGKEDRG